jgi:integrase/recombinase XerD
MKLSEAITLYVNRRRAAGAYLRSSEKYLRSFLNRCGNVDLCKIRPTMVTKFLHGRTGVMPNSWLVKYSALKMFFMYWSLRDGGLPRHLLPPSLPKRTQNFVPYIYSQSELRRLLEAIPHCQRSRACRMSSVTFRALLLVLYGTGMRLGEALGLLVADVDLTQDIIRIRETKFYKSRLVPIGRDMHRIVEEYLGSPNRTNEAYRPLFQSKSRERIKRAIAQRSFRRLRQMSKVMRYDASPFQPRIHDLRHTFAVHRVIEWYRLGGDVQKLLPSLSTYLGHVSLESTQRYLTMTPDLLKRANDRFERYVSGGANGQ